MGYMNILHKINIVTAQIQRADAEGEKEKLYDELDELLEVRDTYIEQHSFANGN